MSVHESEFAALPNAVEAVRRLQASPLVSKVVVFTVGERADQMRKLYRLGLQDVVCENFIHKDFTLFRVMMHRWPARHYTMIGDSRTRDIEPALRAGIHQIVHITPAPLQEPEFSGILSVPLLATAVDQLLGNLWTA
jgi:FMN phosphatase YigB (HAD superfamily)